MHPKSNADRLDDAIDHFEESWNGSLRDSLYEFLHRFNLDGDPPAATELIRIDIARRYAVALPVDLDAYFRLFPDLAESAEFAPLIAFEDFRSRELAELPVGCNRWAHLPGVDSASWFQTLEQKQSIGWSNPPSLATSRSRTQSCTSMEIEDVGIQESAILEKAPPHDDATNSGDDFERLLKQAGFTPLRLIGQGAFSRVFLALQHELSDRQVVLKVVDRPLEEPQHLARLQHTNIVPIYSFHRVGRLSLLCMPYMGSTTLADYLIRDIPASKRSGQSLVTTLQTQMQQSTLSRSSPKLQQVAWTHGDTTVDDRGARLPLDQLSKLAHHELALWIFARLSSALAHSHARGVLHGDLKPANLLIRNDGEPALLDFNLARGLESVDLDWAGGTLPYMPPELLRALMGEPFRARETTDIYSLGVILFEFVTGRLPFDPPRSGAPFDLQTSINQRISACTWIAEDSVPFGLRCIIERCLQPNPDDRYQSAEHLQRDLECQLEHRPLRYTSEPSLRSRVAKWSRRHPRWSSASAIGAVAVVVVASLLGIAWKLSESNRRFAAGSLRDEFWQASNQALALTMYPDSFDSNSLDFAAPYAPLGERDVSFATTDQAIRQADQCLEMYGVLSDPEWRQRASLTYLDARGQQFVIHRLTDLLLRSTSREMRMHRSPEGVSSPTRLDRRLELLRSEPFCGIAPVTTSRLLSSRDGSVAALPGNKIVLRVEHPIDVFSEALFQLNSGQTQRSLQLLSAELSHVIDPLSYWLALGRAQCEAGQLQAAELSFSMACLEAPRSPIPLFDRGNCRLQMRSHEKWVEAERDFGAALEIDDKNAEARFFRGLARELTGDLDGALQDLNAILESPAPTSRAWIVRSRVHQKLGHSQQSQADRELATIHRPLTTEDWVARALIRLPGDAEGALRDLNEAEQLDPVSSLVLQNKAHVLSEHLGRTEQAIAVLDQILISKPVNEKALLGRAVLNARQGNRKAAVSDVETARRQLTQVSAAGLYQIGCVHALLSQLDSTPDSLESQRRRRLAFEQLSLSIQQGYGGDLLESDPDLQAIRDDEAYQHLLQVIQLGRPSLPAANSNVVSSD